MRTCGNASSPTTIGTPLGATRFEIAKKKITIIVKSFCRLSLTLTAVMYVSYKIATTTTTTTTTAHRDPVCHIFARSPPPLQPLLLLYLHASHVFRSKIREILYTHIRLGIFVVFHRFGLLSPTRFIAIVVFM